MARTTAAAVQGILGRNYDGQSDLTPWIAAATKLVDRVADSDDPPDSDTLELIERFIAAHYYTVMDPLFSSKNTGKSSAKFMDRSYLDVAIQLDPSATVSAITSDDGPKVASAIWLGEEDT